MKLSTGKQIEIVENKVLKLKNVLSRDLSSQDSGEIQKVFVMFDSYTKSKNLTPYGPMIIHSRSHVEHGTLSNKSRLLAQLREIPEKTDPPYAFDELVRIENCLLARYRGDPRLIQMAHGKLQVYAFENGITLKNETYTVFIEQTENELIADVFAETVP
ncbi:MAG: hypothetical protein LBM39_00215 [Candidatus Methanoplasma sp.]|nr:hypothetical protein [Candidatus Methanoplasma sp.]